jgi:C_GCAxxG_C_C family probable redox protein
MDRREFTKKSVLIGSGIMLLSLQSKGSSTSILVTDTNKNLSDTKKVFKKCMACSHTFFFLLNREFGYQKPTEELASNPLAGGLMGKGHQCGMLWGSSLAVGAESFRRYNDQNQATATTIATTQHVMESFKNRAKSCNCRDVVGIDFTSKFGLVKLMVKTMLRGGMSHSVCFNLAEKWAPESIQSAKEGLSKQSDFSQKPVSCSSEVIRKMGGSDEEIAMVAGFAGGMGLSGNACGALGAAIWMKTLDWCKKHPGEIPPFFDSPATQNTCKAFNEITGSEILCRKICGQSFQTIDEHTEFMNKGGCSKLIDALAKA